MSESEPADDDGLIYRMGPNNSDGWRGTNSGIKFEADVQYSTSSDTGSFGLVQASDFTR